MTPVVALVTVVCGGVGAVLRYGLSHAMPPRPGRLPWAVLIVNIAGSALAGVVAGAADAHLVDPAVRTVVLSGIAGGLTTFSTFGVETVQLARAGRRRAAVANVVANVALGLAAAAAGFALAHALW